MKSRSSGSFLKLPDDCPDLGEQGGELVLQDDQFADLVHLGGGVIQVHRFDLDEVHFDPAEVAVAHHHFQLVRDQRGLLLLRKRIADFTEKSFFRRAVVIAQSRRQHIRRNQLIDQPFLFWRKRPVRSRRVQQPRRKQLQRPRRTGIAGGRDFDFRLASRNGSCRLRFRFHDGGCRRRRSRRNGGSSQIQGVQQFPQRFRLRERRGGGDRAGSRVQRKIQFGSVLFALQQRKFIQRQFPQLELLSELPVQRRQAILIKQEVPLPRFPRKGPAEPHRIQRFPGDSRRFRLIQQRLRNKSDIHIPPLRFDFR